jgi:hypothetical protein
MSEKRWKITPEIMNILRLIRSNCMLCTDCAYCPLASEDDYLICKLMNYRGGLPESWDLDGLEVYDEKEN